jgi:phage anti-repressor protein
MILKKFIFLRIKMNLSNLEQKEQQWVFFPYYSCLRLNVFDSDTCKYLFNELEKEIKYIPRGELKFKIFNKVIPLPRVKAFYGKIEKDGSYPLYRYSGNNNEYPDVLKWTPTLKLIVDFLQQFSKHYINHCVVNKYEDNNDHIGYHRDKIKDMTISSTVYVLSLGDERIVDMKDDDGKTQSETMTNGSLFELSWDGNQFCKHRVRKEKKERKVRLGLTFRSIRTYKTKTGKIVMKDI